MNATVEQWELLEIAKHEAELAGIPAGPFTLADCHGVFRKWLGADYDTDALDAVLAAAAVERLDGDPVWLLVISGSGNAKTETVVPLAGIGAHMVSTIASEGALLSATSKREQAADATGGLLRKIGDRGILIIKDVTSILSMSGDQRASVLGALREVYDGSWARNVGTDGGQTLEWEGRLVVIGAVTTAWDKAHSVISAMGDRFVLVRMDSTKGRQAAGRQAIGNTGSEVLMRSQLAGAATRILAGLNLDQVRVTAAETDMLLAAADIVTMARTAVERDYRGDVVDAHAPEMPTRFAKQLTQIVRGSMALGMDRGHALRLAIRCARDSMPPLRLKIIDDVAANPNTPTKDVRKRIGLPRATVDRELQALNMLGVLQVDEVDGINPVNLRETTVWHYTLAGHIDPDALKYENTVPEIAVPTLPLVKGSGTLGAPTAESGTVTAPALCFTCGDALGDHEHGHHQECAA
ncbi:hypothetical protein [Arthrobacter sp. TB 26]|uniref:hypothetical protein n=1 Tax=Arthrobacter sp. TB 26 TaxID=494420 RepID=UPI000416BC43|nr:hypothetical protein [Arthrobacter sp. TB 26]